MKYILITFITSLLYVNQVKAQQNIQFVDKYSNIESSSELFDQFKDKIIFLDLWAPWCEPCKEEFKFSADLYKELKNRNIIMLYVSLNTNVTEDDWKSNITKFDLRGYHVLANKNLENSLETLIWRHPGGFSIPRYLLIGKDGKILISDAMTPEHGPELYKQIDKALTLN